MISIKGIDTTILSIKAKAKAIQDVADDELHAAAEKVAEYAREYVPIDEENLQDAIVVEKVPNGYRVKVDMSHKGTRAATVAQYAEIMHEGSYSAKAGWPRGPKYMTRAAAQVRKEMRAEIIPRIERKAAEIGRGVISFIGSFLRAFM